jgi:hypothetical protein
VAAVVSPALPLSAANFQTAPENFAKFRLPVQKSGR